MNTRTYINSAEQAQGAAEEIVTLLRSRRVRPVVALDVETAPLPGLEGYPGTLFEIVEVRDEAGNVVGTEEKIVRAKKAAYLEFVQRIWRGSFNPAALRELLIHIPAKTISGKEDGVNAGAAWSLFMERVNAIYASDPDVLVGERWTAETLGRKLEELREEIAALEEEEGTLKNDLHSMQVMQVTRGAKTKETYLKKVQRRRELLEAEMSFFSTYARERLVTPLPLTLLVHVARVAVEGRIFLDKGGRNRLDPVQPGLDPHTSTVFLVQVTLQEEKTGVLHSYIFNTHKVDIRSLRPVLEMEALFVGANIKFDLKMLMVHAGLAPKKVFCTRIASRMLNLGKRIWSHSLASTLKRYCGVELPKEARNTFVGRRYAEPTPEQLEYAYHDTEVLHELYEALLGAAAKTNQQRLVQTFSCLSWIVAKWEVEGYVLDERRWLEIAAGAAVSRDETARELEEMLLPPAYVEAFGAAQEREVGLFDEELELKNIDFGGDPDAEKAVLDVRPTPVLRISQTELVKEHLGRLLGMELPSLFADGKVSLGKDGRNMLEREYRKRHGGQTHEFFFKYMRWSKLAKQASTYGKRFLWNKHPLTGRVHPSFNIAGTDTGRFTSTNPNLLNVPAAKEEGDPDFRGAFCSAERSYWLGADYDTMEFRVGGDLARDIGIQKMVAGDADPHSFTAAQMFHIRRADVQEPRAVQATYTRGTMTTPVTVFEVPSAWSAEQVSEFALRREVQDAVMTVEKRVTRVDAKNVTFLYLFRGTAFTLAGRTGLPLEVCEDFFARFKQVYAGLDAYMENLAAQSVTQTVEGEGLRYAYTTGYGGIRRYVALPEEPYLRNFPTRYAYNQAVWDYQRRIRRAQRELVNLTCQGGNAVITAQALLYLVERGAPLGVYPKLSIYDEIIVEAPDAVRADRVKGLLESSMLDAADEYMTFVPAGATADAAKAGKRWVKS